MLSVIGNLLQMFVLKPRDGEEKPNSLNVLVFMSLRFFLNVNGLLSLATLSWFVE